jgi:RNA polymerase sigma-70 factor (ECF subfamily)
MRTADQEHGERLERFRAYLRLLARQQLGAQLRAKIDESDLVQQTFKEAIEAWGQFQGKGDEVLAGWLRKALAHNLVDAARSFGRGKRDMAQERRLEEALEASSCRLGALLAADQSSPSERAVKVEEILRLAGALDKLPEAQREAIELQYLQGASQTEIAARLDRSEPAVAGLVRRGLKKLRELMRD